MTHILNKIVDYKRKEIAIKKELYPIKLLEKSIHFLAPTLSLKQYLLKKDKSGIIAEFKRKSPSKGIINDFASVERTTIGYMQAGASALSILTDSHFFGGSNKDLEEARFFNFCPILRKDFVLEEYQILEAKSIGADAILLIAAILSPDQIRSLTQLAQNLGLEVLLEVHHQDELIPNLNTSVDLIGVNNRDLKTFETDIIHSKNLFPLIPAHIPAISESGISDPQTIHELREVGFKGFLMGEHFMKQSRPEQEAYQLLQNLKKTLQTQITTS